MKKQKTIFEAPESAAAVDKLPERSQVSDEHKWRLEALFAKDDDWEKTFSQLEEQIPRLASCAGNLGKTSQNLLSCLKLRDQIEETFNRLYLYAGLKNDEDTRENQYQALRDRATSLMVKINQAAAFIEPEILDIPAKKLESFINNDAELRPYRHILENLQRSKAHILPPEQETLLALSGEITQALYTIFSMFNNADITFPTIRDEQNREIEVTKGRYQRLLESPDRRVRKDAFEAFYGTYRRWTNTLAATLSSGVKRDIFLARARKYHSSLEAALDPDNIPTSVYSNVVDTINRNLKPLHRYMALRKKMLGLDDLRAWDLTAPLLGETKFDIPYNEALETIRQALSPLGEEYMAALEHSFKDGWIDVYENQGKRSGAYSWATFGAHPYILLNYDNTLNDMFTVAHELGHALHSYYTFRTQPYHYSEYTIFVAEVASTLNEALLIDHLLKNNRDREKRLYLLNKYVDQVRGTVYAQAMFAEFEKIIHERAEAGQALTAELLNQLTRELYTRYFGPEFVMDPEYDVNWCRIPHFYYNFYVFKYATGFSAATALSRKILAGDVAARDAYLHFLSRGSSDYSINLLKDAGVDMTSPQPIEATIELLDRLLDEMESL